MTQEWPSYPGSQPVGGFSADPASAPHLRASNADRAHAATVIDEAYADGRLSGEEHAQRLTAAAAAVTLGDLVPLVVDVDLPSVADPTSTRLPVPVDDPASTRSLAPYEAHPVVTRPGPRRVFGLPRWWLQTSVALVVIWLMTGVGGGGWSSFWPIYPILGTLLYLLIAGGSTRRRSRRDRRD